MDFLFYFLFKLIIQSTAEYIFLFISFGHADRFMRQGYQPCHAPATAVKQQGSCSAHSTFAWLSFCPERRRQRCLQNPAAFLLKRAQPGCRKCGSFFLYAKKRQTAGFCLAVCLLCCYFVLRSVAEIPIKAF